MRQEQVLEVKPIESGISNTTGKEWKKRLLITRTIEEYPVKHCFQVWGEGVDTLSLVNVNDILAFESREISRESNGRWYTEMNAFGFARLNPTTGIYEDIVAPQQNV